jgi:hypothetical protein
MTTHGYEPTREAGMAAFAKLLLDQAEQQAGNKKDEAANGGLAHIVIVFGLDLCYCAAVFCSSDSRCQTCAICNRTVRRSPAGKVCAISQHSPARRR